jgi:hypothetical protein
LIGPPVVRLFALAGLLLLPCQPCAAADDQERPTAGGRLIWDSADELDLLGDLWVDLVQPVRGEHSLFFALDLRTTIEKATSDLTFKLRDLDYDAHAGWRMGRPWLGGSYFSIFAGERGKANVDDDGWPLVDYIGCGLESDDGNRFSWDIAGGAVVRKRGIDADVVVRGAAAVLFSRYVAELKADGLIDGGDFLFDISAGPGLIIPTRAGSKMKFFLHYQRSRNPLGIGHDAVLAGYEYAGGATAFAGPPEIGGVVSLGAGGEERIAARLLLKFLTPPLGRDIRISFDVDANVLTARDVEELYYLYHLGLERPLGGSVVGIYYYHRSNHQLSDPNDTVTSINVLETGIETDGWRTPGSDSPSARWGGIEARARFGYLLDSAFGEECRWHVRGGLRWSPPFKVGPLSPFLSVEAEAGDVERQGYAVGVAIAEFFSCQLEFRNDEQFFGEDRTALLLLGSYSF